MEKDQLSALLAEVFGHLQLNDAQDDKLWKEGLPLFANSLLVSKDLTVKSESFSFERSQLFAKERIKSAQMEKIRETVEKIEIMENAGQTEKIQKAGATEKIKAVEKIKLEDPTLKPFVRDVPVRTTQIKTSVPLWAAGAKVEKTIGPLVREDGRLVLIDFYKVVKLLGLYQQNSALPVILFQAEFQTKLAHVVNTPPPEVAGEYKIVAGSVWIRADMLANSAPSNRYAGLKVTSGKIQLSQNPVLQNGKLVLGAQTGVQVSLNLGQDAPVAVTEKKYGKDGLAAKLKTPDKFAFSFTGSTKAQIAAIGAGEAELYGQKFVFQQKNAAPGYNAQVNRLLIPMTSNQPEIKPVAQKSPLLALSESAPLKGAAWAIPAAELDVANPLEAAGCGGYLLEGKPGLKCTWQGLQAKNLKLQQPLFLVDPGRIGMTELTGEGEGAFQEFEHWQDEQNAHGTSLSVFLGKKTSLMYNSLAEGIELLVSTVNAVLHVDRPVMVNGLPVGVKTKDSLLILAGYDDKNLLYLIDDNILWDNKIPHDKVPKFKSLALALENALFTVTPVNGAMVFGTCSPDWKRIIKSQTILVFGLLGYLPTLPDPYLANLTYLRRLQRGEGKEGIAGIISWLVCQISQDPVDEKTDKVKVSFHFGNETNEQQSTGSGLGVASGLQSATLTTASMQETKTASTSLASETIKVGAKTMRSAAVVNKPLPQYEEQVGPHVQKYQNEFFALLDVSSNANQMGVSLGAPFPVRVKTGVAVGRGEQLAHIEQTSSQMFGVDGMEVVVRSSAARLFMLPQVAWEPVYNLTPPGNNVIGDPPLFFNYYPNDGGATRIANYHAGQVPFAPKPLVKYTLEQYKSKKTPVDAYFTLPFGLKALAELSHDEPRESQKPELNLVNPSFPNELVGGIQIRAIAKDYGKDAMQGAGPDSPMFKGFTVQLANVLGMNGLPANASTLGRSVTKIFNGEFFTSESTPDILKKRGVPLSKIDFSGYGASTFSNWLSPRAAIAETSQARFDIMLGRTGHEVIQVKSILYPWGIRVVRTITLFRTGSGHVYRTDSGWQAESDGLFDFRYRYIDKNLPPEGVDESGNTIYHTVTVEPYELHTGPVRGLFNVNNIQEDGNIAEYNVPKAIKIAPNEFYVDEFGEWVKNGGTEVTKDVILGAVWFDGNIKIDNLVQGHKSGMTPSKKILGYVQLAPQGVTIPKANFKALLDLQGGLIGGDVDCIMNLNNSGQMMRITRFDISPSVKKTNDAADPIFVAAARGSVLLPKDGSWSVVQHETGTGEVTPLPAYIPVPIVREGAWKEGNVLPAAIQTGKLLRLAHPLEILRNPVGGTMNFGLLQTTATQKTLFLTPSFEFGKTKLLSKTPPAFADAYRLMDSSSIFPNIGDGYTNLGKAVALVTGVDANGNPLEAFKTNPILDGDRTVFELMELVTDTAAGEVIDRGFKLLTGEANELLGKAMAFDIPSLDPLYLVKMDALKIYIEYKAKETKAGNPPAIDSKLNFDVDSFANDLKDKWKSRLNNVGMVVDLGSFERLMTIKGNFDAQKGKESGYEGGPDNPNKLEGLPTPEIEFSEDLQPVIDLLQMLASMSTGNYAEVLKKGLQIAMSNAGEIWEYKFEATKEIPLVRFPPEDNLYNAPQCPLRLEAGLSLGVYFNAALKVTTDPTQLLPTAGGFIQFKGGLEVMCLTVGGATVYAIGAVELKVACDTKVGPNLTMKFGFGASLSVGLPVIGNVSVTFMVGCEIYASAEEISVTAFMMFKGHASLIGGLVSVTIYIEASGTVKRSGGKTDCTASVTFGLDISICFIINISFEETWQEGRQIA